jgi:hypothetical protein
VSEVATTRGKAAHPPADPQRQLTLRLRLSEIEQLRKRARAGDRSLAKEAARAIRAWLGSPEEAER